MKFCLRFVLPFLGVLGLAAPAPALDFTPQETWRELEGVRIPLIMFTDPTGRIRYQPPGGWNYSGAGNSLALYPPDSNGAFMKMTVLGHAAGLPAITDIPSADLTKWCQNYIAKDAEELKLLDENPSPFMLTSRPSREFIFEYKSGGQRFQSSIAVLDWSDHEHMAVVITALAAEFKNIHNDGIASLFSWNLRKSDPATPKAAGATADGQATPVSTTAAAPGPTPIRATGH